MISDRTLALASERGLLTAEQVAGLRALEIEGDRFAVTADDERLRFITGFADIFVTIGILLFLGGLGSLTESYGLGWQMAALALASWALAEFFTRRRRMALPSIALLIAFASSVFLALAAFLTGLFGNDAAMDSIWHAADALFKGSNPAASIAIAGAGTALATALHYYRFRVPITIAAGCLALVTTALGIVAFIAPDFLVNFYRPLLFVMGLAVFALAWRFDAGDLSRQTRRADIAFWLHMLAAPMIVHPLVGYFVSGVVLTREGAMVILSIFAVLSVIAILIDRRAMLVSGLTYLGIALASLLRDTVGLSDILASTVIGLGAFILLISAGWQPLRRIVLGAIPASVARIVPPAHGAIGAKT